MHPGLRHQSLRGARVGLLAGLCLAALYVALGALGTTDFNKSLGYSLLLLGFPILFAVVPALHWLGLEGGTYEGIAALLVTLSVNGAMWGALLGAGLSLGSLPRR